MKPEQFTSTMKQREVVDELERVTAAAHKAGVFGVPSFVVGSDLFWGNDRLVLLREHLRSRSRC